MSSYKILVASYTDSIATLEFKPPEDNRVATLTTASSLKVGFCPGWITRDVTDPTIYFAGMEGPDGRVTTLRYDPRSGAGKILSGISSGGHTPCSILALETEVLVANYMSGTVAFFSKHNAGRLEESQPTLKYNGTGPNTVRQDRSHTHEVYHIKRDDHDEVLVPDLGTDKMARLIKDNDGKWKQAGELVFDKHPGGGPRHVIFYENILYTLLELSCELTAHTFPPLKSCNKAESQPKLLASSPTLLHPPVSPPEAMITAELLLPLPNTSFPKAHIYVSNRNDPHPEGDTIAIFAAYDAIHALGELMLLKEVRTGLGHIKGMIFFGPEDRYLIAGGAVTGGIKVFERVDGGADLREVAHLPVGTGPGGNLEPTGFAIL